jgi:hypothetical protein
VREPVPCGEGHLPDGTFKRIHMGVPAEELVARCGEPDGVDTVTMDGVQIGVGSDRAVDGYLLSLWYYERSVMYVINGRVWGRAHYESQPMRIRVEMRP